MPDIPCRKATAIRNRLIHAYFDVDRDVLWKTATEALRELMQQLEAIIGQWE